MKGKFKGLGILAIFLGMALSRTIGDKTYFGLNGRVLTGIICVVFLLIIISIAFIKRQYAAALVFFGMAVPLAIAFIGIYMDNLKLVFGGIIGIFIIMIIEIKALKKYTEKRSRKIKYYVHDINRKK
ncbi:hypothetical protein [Clostridium sp. YIM B02551]|uniref:hypothetical protein n=1 Tax=Clostridium sp. YIM B02551 TaxID=2910679 RepID=UPI001EEA6BAD|nr:hypothetical protein [Clostridium sp. YIM B02551]